MKPIIWAIQIVVFYLFTLAMSAVPDRRIRSVGRRVGLIMQRLLAKRRRIAIDNIRQALPSMKRHPAWSCPLETPEDLARETFIHLGMSLVEICRLYHGKGGRIIDAIEVRGREHFDRARAKNKGLIFVTAHCGNWELMALSIKRLLNENMWVIARHQNNPYLNTLVDRMRMHYDNKVIYNKAALRPTLAVLKNRGIVGMLTDQAVFPDNGALIEVLGRQAWANKAPAIIAHKTGVPLLPVFIHRGKEHHVITFYPEYELCGDKSETGVQLDIQALSRYLEDFICAHPTDWYWVHRRWKRAGKAV